MNAGAVLCRMLVPRLGARLVPLRTMASSGGGLISKIGNREIVGFGFNGEANYVDRVDFPMPAIRFKEPTPDLLALREKEKGDWRMLSIEEKKELYRASFCQTFAEMKAPSGEWKSAIGIALLFVSLGIWIFMALKVFVMEELPLSYTAERQQAQLERMIALGVNPVTGLASRWDYENNDWKK